MKLISQAFGPLLRKFQRRTRRRHLAALARQSPKRAGVRGKELGAAAEKNRAQQREPRQDAGTRETGWPFWLIPGSPFFLEVGGGGLSWV